MEIFVIFSKENKSVCKNENIWWMHMHSFVRVFHVETVCRNVERRGELRGKDYDMQSQRLRNTKLGGVFVYLNPRTNLKFNSR